jgi:starch phosphorylase
MNTPRRPMEASGTSGMKAAINGVPSLSTIDGWWAEGWQEDITGWSVDHPDNSRDQLTLDEQNIKDANNIYDKLENNIVPCFYNHHEKWVEIMKNCITKNATIFNSHRMVQQYWDQAWSK